MRKRWNGERRKRAVDSRTPSIPPDPEQGKTNTRRKCVLHCDVRDARHPLLFPENMEYRRGRKYGERKQDREYIYEGIRERERERERERGNGRE